MAAFAKARVTATLVLDFDNIKNKIDVKYRCVIVKYRVKFGAKIDKKDAKIVVKEGSFPI